MTYENKINWLNRYSDIYYTILDLQEEMGAITELSSSVLSHSPKAKSIGSINEKILIKRDNLEKEIIECYEKLEIVHDEIRDKINSLDNIKEKRVLRLKFVSMLEINKLAEAMDLTISSVNRICRSAINNLEFEEIKKE